jgi:putative phosphoribosyl transferase
MGYFGASIGAAAALVAAATDPRIGAIVARGGRPDLAWDVLPHVAAPTLLIVGELDHDVLRMNRAAYARLGGRKQLSIVPGATHLFEEPGTLDVAARLAVDWFAEHLGVET